VADYHTEGEITPDAKGNYVKDGLYNGRMSYRRTDGVWFIWWDSVFSTYRLTSIKGTITNPCWGNDNDLIAGDYSPNGTAIGFAQVRAGPG
jgi:hypothetical protein